MLIFHTYSEKYIFSVYELCYKNQYNLANCIMFFSYLNKGIVERLEVVNKKWVRVRLLQGNSVDGSVSFYELYDLKF